MLQISRPFGLFLAFSALATITVAAGCHRGFYRRQADAEALALIRDKANHPRWSLPDGTIDIARESRMYNPFSADHPPMPPDDPSSHEFMEVVDGKPAYSHWHANGDTGYIESPDWIQFLPVNAAGIVVLDMQRAVSMALSHSTSYQRQREELYLSALDVSLERFGFDSQLFAGVNAFFTSAGRFRGTRSSSTLDASTSGGGVQLQRLGAAGGTFAVGVANSVLWQFAGADTQTASSLINFSVVQPLLTNGGRARILESLTQAERTLLANVRQMEQFRRGFYLQITTGRNPGQGPSRGGNFLSSPSSGSGAAGGYIGLLQTQQAIRIQEFNVASLRNVLDQFIEFSRAERLDALQLSQAETSLYDAQRRLLSSRTGYQTELDRFKRTLGLPPALPIQIDDPYLRTFELIDDQNNDRQNQLAEVKVETGDTLVDVSMVVERDRFLIERPPPADQPADPDAADPLQLIDEYGVNWSDELRQKLEMLVPLVDQIEPLVRQVSEDDVGRVLQDIQRLEQVRPNRADALQRLRARIQEHPNATDLEVGVLQEASLENPARLQEGVTELGGRLDQLQADLARVKLVLAETIQSGQTMAPKDLYLRLDVEILTEIPRQLTELGSVSLELSLIQALARTDAIELPQVDLDPELALEIARSHRRDWMNARAGLVDSWRRIEVVANQLESQLDLVLEGDMGNVGDNPFRIRYETGQLRAGFRFDSPVTRLAERNQYRQQLIQYQRDRRSYYEFEDEVSRILRQTLREIELNKILFELNRRSVKVAVQQVEQARFRLVEPQRSITERSQLGATTARDLTGAINNLQANQNSFLDVWVTFEVLRRSLDFDLGTMEITDDGFWLDPGVIDETIGDRVPADLIPEDPNAPAEFPDLGRYIDGEVPVDVRIGRAHGVTTEQP